MGPRRLRVWLDAAAVGLRDATVHEYGLDAIQVRGVVGMWLILKFHNPRCYMWSLTGILPMSRNPQGSCL